VKSREWGALRSLEKAWAFCIAEPFGGARGTQVAAQLRECTKEVGTAAVKQRGRQIDRSMHTRAGKHLRQRLRRGLMIPIARDAALHLTNVAGVLSALEVPHATARLDALIAAAERMANALAPYAAYLVRHGMERRFLAALRKGIRDLKRWHKATPAAKRHAIDATAEVAAGLRHGRRLVAVLDGLAMAHGEHHRGFYERWRHTRKIPRKTGRPRKPPAAS